MTERLRLEQAVIVEGKYDKIKLESVLDALILTTNGYGIFKDAAQRELVCMLARQRGLVVLTDSDAAGFRIRGYLKGLVPADQITHVYIPALPGKEPRKAAPSAEGTLGVEGMDAQVLREAFEKAGLVPSTAPAPADPVTRLDFYDWGLVGAPGSAELRRKLYAHLGLPPRLSTSAALDILPRMCARAELEAILPQLRENT